MAVEDRSGRGLRRSIAPWRGGRIDLVAGVLLGLVLGVVIAYLLVIVVGGSRDASEISIPSSPPGDARSGEDARARP